MSTTYANPFDPYGISGLYSQLNAQRAPLQPGPMPVPAPAPSPLMTEPPPQGVLAPPPAALQAVPPPPPPPAPVQADPPANPQGLLAQFLAQQQQPSPQPSSSLPRGLRNNNPLNIEAGPFASGMPGFLGSDGRFARFETADQGIQAADRLLQSYAGRGLTTPSQIIGRWAPAADGNDVGSYARSVAAALGVSPDTPLDMQDPTIRRRLIDAMSVHENGTGGPSGGSPRPAPTAPPRPTQTAQASPTTASDADLPPVAIPPPGPAEVDAQPRGWGGMTADNWFALGAGILGGRDLNDGLSRGLGGLVETRQRDRQERLQRGSEAERRALTRVQLQMQDRQQRLQQLDRRDSRAQADERIAIDRERLGLERQRVDQLGLNTGHWAGQTIVQNDDGTQGVVQANSRTGEIRVVPIPGRRAQDANRSDPIATAESKTDREYSTGVYEAASAARDGLQATANLREVLRTNPNLTGSSWRQQGGRAIAQALGMNVDGKSPEAIDAALRQLTTLETQQLVQMAPIFKPMSNTDVPTILRQIPGILSNPANINAWLDEIDRKSGKAVARADALEKFQATGDIGAYRGSGGLSRWGQEWERNYETSRRQGTAPIASPPQATIEPAPGGGYQSRTRSGVGFTFTQ